MRLFAAVIVLFGLMISGRGEADTLPINQLPMYGGQEKTAAMKEADEKFLATIADMGHTRESGSKEVVQLGWKYFFKGDIATAMLRFNQAWLLNPENGDAYHGFAVVTAVRGGSAAEIEKHFKTAIAKPEVGGGAYAGYARFLNIQGRFDEAIAQAQQGLAVDPATSCAAAQMSYAYLSKQDTAQACMWARKAEGQCGADMPPDYVESVC